MKYIILLSLYVFIVSRHFRMKLKYIKIMTIINRIISYLQFSSFPITSNALHVFFVGDKDLL